MDVKKTKNLRLRITERVQHGAGFERGVFRQIHDELHADGPVADVMAVRQTKNLVELAPDGADGTVGDDCQCGVDVHAGRKAVGRIALFVHALIEQADADDFGTARRSSAVRLGCGLRQRPAASRNTRRDAW